MKWIELLRRQLPLADIDAIWVSAAWCPAAFFGDAAPSAAKDNCEESCLERMCWANEDVPPEVLTAHGITPNETRVTLCLTPETITAGSVLTEDEVRRVREAIKAAIEEEEKSGK